MFLDIVLCFYVQDVQMGNTEANSSQQEGKEDSSRPLCPHVGMVFNNIEEAQLFYNRYAEKLGFGSRIGCSRRSQKKGCDHLIRRDFECAHARKPKLDGNGGEAGLDPEVFDGVEEGTEATTDSVV
jgi:hypothetical protein